MKTLHKAIIGFFLLLVALLLVMIALSPYKKDSEADYKRVNVTVDINASPEKVFNYLGNSNNASEWSTFVDHITPLNPDQKQDGTVGALRRCFRYADESGEIWDEEILVVEKNKLRQLSCFNFQNFSLTAENLRTEQIYQELEDGTTRLSFTLFFKDGQSSLLDELKMHYASYLVASIFEDNLEQIKYFTEN